MSSTGFGQVEFRGSEAVPVNLNDQASGPILPDLEANPSGSGMRNAMMGGNGVHHGVSNRGSNCLLHGGRKSGDFGDLPDAPNGVMDRSLSRLVAFGDKPVIEHHQIERRPAPGGCYRRAGIAAGSGGVLA